MSKPVFIWTCRRTGGTTLTSLINGLSEYPKVDQEPFNWDRCFGAVAKAWHDERDPDRLRAGLDRSLSDFSPIKHCYELHADSFNMALFDAATRLGYRHMILDRRDEVGRILSLELAKLTGAWGKMGAAERYRQFETGEEKMPPIDIKSAVAQMRLCASRRFVLDQQISQSGQAVRQVFFEDIYKDTEKGRRMIHEILADFELDRPGDPVLEGEIGIALIYRGQNSSRMLNYIPNLEIARQRLEKAVADLRSGAKPLGAARRVAAGGALNAG